MLQQHIHLVQASSVKIGVLGIMLGANEEGLTMHYGTSIIV
jgi:hypothetical protein